MSIWRQNLVISANNAAHQVIGPISAFTSLMSAGRLQKREEYYMKDRNNLKMLKTWSVMRSVSHQIWQFLQKMKILNKLRDKTVTRETRTGKKDKGRKRKRETRPRKRKMKRKISSQLPDLVRILIADKILKILWMPLEWHFLRYKSNVFNWWKFDLTKKKFLDTVIDIFLDEH